MNRATTNQLPSRLNKAKCCTTPAGWPTGVVGRRPLLAKDRLRRVDVAAGGRGGIAAERAAALLQAALAVDGAAVGGGVVLETGLAQRHRAVAVDGPAVVRSEEHTSE